jgi:hypothetical protein
MLRAEQFLAVYLMGTTHRKSPHLCISIRKLMLVEAIHHRMGVQSNPKSYKPIECARSSRAALQGRLARRVGRHCDLASCIWRPVGSICRVGWPSAVPCRIVAIGRETRMVLV